MGPTFANASLQRHEQVETRERLLTLYEEEENSFLSRIITGDRSSFYYYQPESKQSSKQWEQADSPPPRSLSKRSQKAKFCMLFSGIIMMSF